MLFVAATIIALLVVAVVDGFPVDIYSRSAKVHELAAFTTTTTEPVQNGKTLRYGEIANQYTNHHGSHGVNSNECIPLYVDMEQLVAPRPYYLLLAEKFAEFWEHCIGDTTSKLAEALPTFCPDASKHMAKKNKEKIVILGTGWGSITFLKKIDTTLYDVIVVSPSAQFIFTPMLAGASVGTMGISSITENVQEINGKATYVGATATKIDTVSKTVTCRPISNNNEKSVSDDTADQIGIKYDHLIVSVGATTNTYGVPGVREHCCFLRGIRDARRIRNGTLNCFEHAKSPSLTDQERQKLLTFVVIGAGPTGVEFASELRDFVETEGPRYYKNLLRHVSIKVVEASSTILAQFDKTLQEEAIVQLTREARDSSIFPPNYRLTELLLEKAVKHVTEDAVVLNDGTSLPYGVALWATGNGPLPLTLDLIDSLGDVQAAEQSKARGRLAVDPWMRVVGSDGSVFALGDCSFMTKSPVPESGQAAVQEAAYVADILNKKFKLNIHLVRDRGSELPTSLRRGQDVLAPPVRDSKHLCPSEELASLATKTRIFAKPFQYLDMGKLVYTGAGTALAEVGSTFKGKGSLGNTVWRSVYLTKQVSWRNRLMVLGDWSKRAIFGRIIDQMPRKV